MAISKITGASIANGTITASLLAADTATQAELDAVSGVANAALPKAGGAMTGAITTNSTFDGVDIATVIAANTAKVTNYNQTKADIDALGIAATSVTGAQASAITANTAKVTNYNQTKADIDALGISASSITGALPAISGAALTGIDAATVATTAPSSPAAGDMWFDSTSGITAMKVYNGTEWNQLRIVELGNYVSSGLYSYWDVSSVTSYSGTGNTLYDLAGSQNLTNSGDTPSVQGTGLAKYFSQSSGNYPYWTATNRNYGLQNASIEIWLFTTNGTSDDYLFNFYSGSTTGNSRAMRLSGGQVSLVGNGSSTQDQNSLGTLTSNQWYQFVFTYQATDNVVIYKNGASIGSFTKDLTDGGGGDVSLGNTFWYGANDTNVWKGGWAACRYYTKTLTSTEVSINWNGTKARFGL